MTKIIVGLFVLAFGAAIVGGIMAARRENARDEAMADRLDTQRQVRKRIEELDRLRDNGAC